LPRLPPLPLGMAVDLPRITSKSWLLELPRLR